MEVVSAAGAWRVRVPAGQYFLGDPCYPFSDSDHSVWMQLLGSCGFFACAGYPNGSPVGKIKDFDVLGFSTKWGDGGYFDQFGAEYSVDAGLIGLVPMGLITELEADLDFLRRCGQLVEFEHEVIASTDGEGRLRFGTFEINTNDGDDPDYEDEDEDEDDEEYDDLAWADDEEFRAETVVIEV
jgi:hypothetical protein